MVATIWRLMAAGSWVRLQHLRKFGGQRGEQWTRHQLGDAPATVGVLEWIGSQRPPIEAFDQLQLLVE
ncbi:hypothetical protein [Nocardia sp. CA-120079]|uniref:hypothetical protein n=1 Tax=Nocardia sp. CA-120079 TaxID=3239974 RepID=UPI003D95D4ED